MSEESKTHLVPVRIFSGNTARLDAELARGLLAQEGIECEIPGEVAADTFPFLEVQLLVREEDANRAAQFLESTLAAAGPEDQSTEDEEEPEAG